MSLRVWLPLNKDLRNNGLKNVTVTNNGATLSDSAYLFNGSSSWLTVGNSGNLITGGNKPFSLSIWVKGISNTPSYQTIFGNWNVDNIGGNGFNFVVENGKFRYWWNSSQYETFTNFSIDLNLWTHISVTYSGTELKVYKNGALIKTNTVTLTNRTYSSNNCRLGSDGNPRVFNGSLYDFRIYDHALSIKEVKELAKGLYLHYTFNDPYVEPTINLFNGVKIGLNYDRWEIATTYPAGMTITSTVYKQKNSDCYFGRGYEFFSEYQNPTIYNGKYLTFSCWYYRNSAASKTINNNFIVYGNNGTTSYSTMTSLVSKTNTEVIGKWAYGTVTIRFFDDLSGYLSITFLRSVNGLNDDLYITNIQLEFNDHATPYVPDSRPINLNSANWTGGAGYWTLNSQSLNEIKFTKTSSQYSVIAIQNAVLKAKLPVNKPITISGYLYNGNTPYKTTSSTINTQYNAVTILSWESRDDGYFRYTFKYGNLNSDWLFHAGFFGTRSEGDISYIRNMKWHLSDNIIIDNSGFGNNGLVNGNLQVLEGSARGSYCTKFDGNAWTKTLNLPSERLVSYSFWIYLSSYVDRGIVFIGDSTSKICFSFYGGAYLILAAGDSAIPGARFDRTIIPLNKWTHIACNYKSNDHSTIELYVNGVKQTANAAEWYSNPYSNILNIGARNNGGISYNGVISDLRIYTTYLSESDIQNLYKDSFIIDDTQKSYCYELNESDSTSQVKFNETGVAKCKSFSESLTSVFDDTEYIEPDGSVWIRIFHHNSPSTNGLFASSDSFTTSVYKDANRWFNVSVCNKVSKWELMVKQKAESSSTEQKYRWIQNANPMTAAPSQVKTANIIINTNGYAEFTTYGGICKNSATDTYLCHCDDSNANWYWGTFGKNELYEGGIESFRGIDSNQMIIKTGYLDLYLRIDNLTEIMDTKISENGSLIANEIIEL